MKGHEIQRALRLITAPDWKRFNRFPIAVIAELAGVHRTLVYQLRNGRCLTGRVLEALSPVLEDILAGKLVSERTDRQWTVRRVENPAMQERRFVGRTEAWRNWAETPKPRRRASDGKDMTVTPDGRASRPKPTSR